jgi:hypothetical protein
MSNNFNLRRWWRLVSLHWSDNKRRYLLAVLVIAGLMILWFGLFTVMNSHWPVRLASQEVTYFVGLFFIGGLYGSMTFSQLNRKSEGIQYLMLPASHLEKLLCGLFFGVFLFFIVYTTLFYLTEVPMAVFAKRLLNIEARENGWNDVDFLSGPRIYNIFSVEDGLVGDQFPPAFLMTYFCVQAGLLLGTIYFVRYSILKTMLTMIGVVLLTILFLAKVATPAIPHGWYMLNLFEWRSYNSGEVKWIRLPAWTGYWSYQLAVWGLPIIFWVTAYFRLKEKEV